MQDNEYALQALVALRLSRARGEAARRQLLREGQPAGRLRHSVGHALIRAGQWLADLPAPVRGDAPALAPAGRLGHAT
jgi:hypothetical protein